MKIIELMGPTGVGKSWLSSKLSIVKKRRWFVESDENFINRIMLKYYFFKNDKQLNIKNINSDFLLTCRESLNQYKNSDAQFFHSIIKLNSALSKNITYRSINLKKNKIVVEQGISQKIFFANPHYSQHYEHFITSYFKHMPKINGLIIIKEKEELIFDRIKNRKSVGSEMSAIDENEIIPLLKKYNHWCDLAHRAFLQRNIPVFTYSSEHNTLEELVDFINNI